MAEDDKSKEESAGKAEPPKKRRSLVMWIAISVAALAVLGGVGGFFFLKQGEPAEEKAAAEGHANPAPAKKAHGAAETPKEGQKAGVIFDLDPFVVNLADTPEIRYLKVSIKLQIADGGAADTITGRLPQVRDSLLLLLSSKTYEELRTVEGKMDLREEILQRVNTVLGATVVTAAYFTDFVAQ